MATPPHPNTRHCAYIKVDGNRCGSPAWQEFDFCWHHYGLKQRFLNKVTTIPPLDDANSIQVAIMEVMNGLISGRIPRADAHTLLRALHIARSNVKAVTLVPPSPEELTALIAKARQEAYEEGKTEAARARAKQGEEDSESLSAYLIKELKRSDPSYIDPDEPHLREKGLL